MMMMINNNTRNTNSKHLLLSTFYISGTVLKFFIFIISLNYQNNSMRSMHILMGKRGSRVQND